MNILLAQAAVSPLSTAGASTPTAGNSGVTFASIVSSIVQVINVTVVPLLFTIAFLVFIAGMTRYIFLGQGNEESREKGKKLMIYGVIAFVVLFGIWGIVNFFVSLLAGVGGVSATQSSV